jgi:hypothetical protein
MRDARILGACCVVVAVLRAATADAPPRAAELSEAQQRDAFAQLAAKEPAQRAQAATDFPGDAWSQDDAFHAFARSEAAEYARSHGATLQSTLQAFDTGLREHWPTLDGGAAPRARVAPCHPRPID